MNDDTPIYNSMSEPPKDEKPNWLKKILTPTFRKWAYGVASALVAVYAAFSGNPEFAAVIAPLLLAFFYVDSNGDAK